MFGRSVFLSALLGLSAAFVVMESDEGLPRRRTAHYDGPLAPLNKDGTVALTPEVQHSREAHEAAIAAEFKRLEEAKKLAAAHPDLTSLPHHGWSVHNNYNSQYLSKGKEYHPGGSGYNMHAPSHEMDSHRFYASGKHSKEPSHKTHMPAPLNKDGTVALTPEVQMAIAGHEAALKAELKRLMEAQRLAMAHPDRTSPTEYAKEQNKHGSNSVHELPYPKNPDAQMPAPLNPDGTVAQTAAYKAIASSLKAEYEKLLHKIKHQAVDPHFQNMAAEGYAY